MLLFLILGNIAMILALNRAVAIETDPQLAKKGLYGGRWSCDLLSAFMTSEGAVRLHWSCDATPVILTIALERSSLPFGGRYLKAE